MRTARALAAAGALSLLLAACGDDEVATEPETTEAAGAADEEMADEEMAGEEMAGEEMAGEEMADEEMAAELAPWQELEITDLDGETFTLADLRGTPVFVEFFATWCPSCREQLERTQEAAAEVGDGGVFLALSTEVDLDPADVAAYAESNGFSDIRFAVMTPELLAAVTDDLGGSAANPPSTPKVIIDHTGAAGELTTGSEDAESIVAAMASA